MKVIKYLFALSAGFAVFFGNCIAADKKFDFEKQNLDGWEIEGNVAVSPEKAHAGKNSLKLEERSKAVFDFSKKNVPVIATFWILESGANPSPTVDGPRWGLRNEDDDKFCIVLTWRTYLTGYGYSFTGEDVWSSVWYPSINRKKNWSKWEFDFSSESDPAVYSDEDAAKLNLEKMPKGGFLGIYLEGVDAKAGPLYVDDINIKPMK